MLFYITKPDVHECVMGGFRHVNLWTSQPSYHHYPIAYNGLHDRKEFQDKGWCVNFEPDFASAKPILKQDEDLAEKVWSLMRWSCCPTGVSFESHIEWCDTKTENDYDNWSELLYHRTYGREADANANINFKRFLLEINVRTNEVKVITPAVHWYYGEKAIQWGNTEHTQDIPAP